MSAVRIAVGVAVLCAGAAALMLVFEPPPAAANPTAFTSSAQCESCHAQVYAEWSGSQHAQSWINPDVRALSNDFANTDCIDCHAPRPVFETGLGQRVLPRSVRRAEGVDCIACHELPPSSSGLPAGQPAGVAGTIDRPDVACRPRSTRELAQVEHCAACHDQHQTVAQWRASEWASQGVDCIDCHMPPRGGDPARGRDHTMHGGHSIELVRSAVVLTAERQSAAVHVTLKNTGAGHHFPTDERSRAADVFWRDLGASGAPGAWHWLYRFRSPYRHEVGIVDTLLPSNATWEGTIEDAPGAVEVALFYKLSPYWADPEKPDPEREARLVHSVTVKP